MSITPGRSLTNPSQLRRGSGFLELGQLMSIRGRRYRSRRAPPGPTSTEVRYIADFELDVVNIDFFQRSDRNVVLNIGLETRMRHSKIIIGRDQIREDKASVATRW